MISKALEEYIKTMYILNKKNGLIRVTDVAESLEVSKASVNKAVNNLKSEGLLNYEAYGSIELTESGKELARKSIEAYNISYLFLKDILNLAESKANEEADKLKDALSDEALNSLAKYVHKTLNLPDLSCNYDITKERCRNCLRRVEAAKMVKK